MNEPWKPKPCPICKDPMEARYEGSKTFAVHSFYGSKGCFLSRDTDGMSSAIKGSLIFHPRSEWDARTGANDVR